jgi:hypothetical protein
LVDRVVAPIMPETSSNREDAFPSAVGTEFSEFARGFNGAGAWESAVDVFGEYLHEGFGQDPWSEVASRIEGCLAEGQPAAFIRIGDGEGNLLALGLDERPALAQHCARACSLLHLGASAALVDAAPEVLAAFHAALRNSDLIGFPGPFGTEMLLTRSNAETYARPIYGLACAHRYLTRFAADLELGRKTGAPAGFHRGLLPHYGALVSGRRIGIVTCHAGLAEGLRTRMGAEAVDLRLVPPQAAVAAGPRTDTGHWPDRYRELVRELKTIEPGNLWFVAAGMLGKVYCDVIRSAGGIAVDIGHTADVWAGVRSRASITPVSLATWRLV